MTPYLRAANVNDGRLDLSDVKIMNFTPDEQRIFSLRPGDVLVSEGSGSLMTVGASAVWSGEIDGIVCYQNTLLRLRPRSQSTDSRFLAWWARHAFASGLFAGIATGANIHHVSAERVRGLIVSFPDVLEQQKVADFLDSETTHIDQLIAKKLRLVALLEERVETLVRQRI
jgi:type I restriction enzyme S subunit